MNTRLIAPNIGRILNDADDSKHALADLAWAELRDLRAMSTRHEAMRAALERIVEGAPKRMPVLDEDADGDDCVEYGKKVQHYTDAKVARAMLDAEKPEAGRGAK